MAARSRDSGQARRYRGPRGSRLGRHYAVLALPMAQRQVMVLRYVEDRPGAEVPELLDVPVGTVKAHLGRAPAALRMSAEEEEHAGP
ncbi:MAG: sigma factor-like helix-turn-helix DNA-binding protein [Acidimicrobiales bacterium]